ARGDGGERVLARAVADRRSGDASLFVGQRQLDAGDDAVRVPHHAPQAAVERLAGGLGGESEEGETPDETIHAALNLRGLLAEALPDLLEPVDDHDGGSPPRGRGASRSPDGSRRRGCGPPASTGSGTRGRGPGPRGAS